MNKDFKDLGNYLEDLLNGEVATETFNVRIKEEFRNTNPDYIPLTFEEKQSYLQNGLTYESAFKCFEDYSYKKRLAKSTILGRNKMLRAFNRYLTNQKIKFSEIREQDIINYLGTKNRLSTSKTTSPHLMVLRVFFNYLFEDNLIEYNPIREVVKQEIKETTTDKKVINSLSSTQVKDIIMSYNINLNNQLRNKLIVMLILDTGITVLELSKIDMEDIFLTQNTIHINTARGGLNRNVIFSEYTKNILELYIKSNELNEGLLFQTNEQAIYLILQRKSKSIGFDCNSKVLRNTFVLHQMRNGRDAYSLQELLGFTTAKALAKYRNEGALCER